jgi:hypothetical protein
VNGARRIVVLGPQRWPTVDAVVGSLGLDGRVATVTAGWQEREPDDAELDALLGADGANLRLYGRWSDVHSRDPEYAAAEREHRAALVELQELYLLQLDGALGALYEVSRHDGRDRVRAVAQADAEAVVRTVDERHLARVVESRAEFEAVWRPAERAVIAEHRAAVRHVLDSAAALVVAGGHVGVLAHVLRLFGVAPVPPTVIAWSAGAMALTERILLFHDRAPHGSAHAEFADVGLGLIPGCVLLPHARRRLRIDDNDHMAVLACRAAPARCVVLDDGVRVDIAPDGALPARTRVIDEGGRVVELVAEPIGAAP